MSDIPFAHPADRNGLHSFFEHHGYDAELQERYYRFWYDFVRSRMESDTGLRKAHGPTFDRYPHGMHAAHNFHLHGHQWTTQVADIGNFVRNTVYPTMTDQEKADLAQSHADLVKQLDGEAEQRGHEESDDIPVFRHT
jgi:hypothetical protein